MGFENGLDFLLDNVLTVEGRMHVINISHKNGMSIADSLVFKILGDSESLLFMSRSERNECSYADFSLAYGQLDHLEIMANLGRIPRSYAAREYARVGNFEQASYVMGHRRGLIAEAKSFEENGDLLLAMTRYEQAGCFGDAKLLSEMLCDNHSRTKAYCQLVKMEEECNSYIRSNLKK